jgi:AmmeMemoRadiSam system protein B
VILKKRYLIIIVVMVLVEIVLVLIKLNIKKPINFIDNSFDKKDYVEAFSKVENIKKSKVLAVITSHHFLAKDLIAKSFAGINSSKIKTIIIISPDHFRQINEADCLIQSTFNTEWKTPFGIVNSDDKFIKNISQKNGLCFSLNTFRGEHGIDTLIPFIKNYYPQATVIPLVLKQKNNFDFFANFGEDISKEVNLDETLLVMSSDFSHYVTTEEAWENDKKSVELLPNKKIEEINQISNDCKQCTAFLFGYLKNKKTDFKLIFNKNSFDISGEDPENVTSYVGAYFY